MNHLINKWHFIVVPLLGGISLHAAGEYRYVCKENVSGGKVSITYQIQDQEKVLLNYEKVAWLGVDLSQNSELKSCFLKIFREIPRYVEKYQMQHTGFRLIIEEVGEQKHFQLKILGKNNAKGEKKQPTWLTKAYDEVNNETKAMPDVFEKLKKSPLQKRLQAFCFSSPKGTVLISVPGKFITCYNLGKDGVDKEVVAWLQSFLTMIYLFYDNLQHDKWPLSRAGHKVAGQTMPHMHGYIRTNVAEKIKQLRYKECPLILAETVEVESGAMKIILNKKALRSIGVSEDRIKKIEATSGKKRELNEDSEGKEESIDHQKGPKDDQKVLLYIFLACLFIGAAIFLTFLGKRHKGDSRK